MKFSDAELVALSDYLNSKDDLPEALEETRESLRASVSPIAKQPEPSTEDAEPIAEPVGFILESTQTPDDGVLDADETEVVEEGTTKRKKK